MTKLVRRMLGGVGVGVVLAASTAAPAFAQDGAPHHRQSAVGITGEIVVPKDETIDDFVAHVHGPVRIQGRVDGDIYVVHGNVTVSGTVEGSIFVARGNVKVSGSVGDDITVIDGRATIQSGGRVHGNVRSSERPRVSGDATVTGDVEKTDFTGWFTAIGFALLAYLWIAVSVSLLVVGIILFALFPRAGDTLVRVGHDAVGRSITWGAIIAVGVPIAAAIAASTVVGLPLGLGALFALGIVFCLGYVVTAAAIGRLLVKEKSGLVAFLAGFGILRVVAIIPGLGVLAWILASAYGVGVLAVGAYRGGRRSSPPGVEAPSAPPSAPPSEPSSDEPVVAPL